MPMSAIIRCHEDEHVITCIDSLTRCSGAHEIVIVLTETSKKIAELLENVSGAKIAWAPVGNLSRSSNIGIKASSNGKIVVLDSDITFSPGYLDVMEKALDNHELVRSKVTFLSGNRVERIVGGLRQSVYQTGVFYCPGVAFQKGLQNSIGGHIFNDEVWWTEDAELDHRIKQAGIPVYLEHDAEIFHKPVGLKYDLNSAFKIGQGKFSQVVSAGRSTFEENIPNTINRIISGESLRTSLNLYKKTRSFAVTGYDSLWTLFYYMGYYKAAMASRDRPAGAIF